MKTIVSLFDYSGNWSKPYEQNYNVIRVDLKRGQDVFDWTPVKCYGMLCAPPCDHFAIVGARWWKQKDLDGRTQQGIKLIERTLELIELCDPEWWTLENPGGRLSKLTKVGEPLMWFHPHWYAGHASKLGGDPTKEQYTKRTYLWGKFNVNLPKNELPVLNKNFVNSVPSTKKQKEIRSTTPLGFSWAFWSANQ